MITFLTMARRKEFDGLGMVIALGELCIEVAAILNYLG